MMMLLNDPSPSWSLKVLPKGVAKQSVWGPWYRNSSAFTESASMLKLSARQFCRPRSFSTSFASLHENPLVRFQSSNCMLARPTLSRACLPGPIQLPRCPVGADRSKRNPYHTSQRSSQLPAERVVLGRVRSQVRYLLSASAPVCSRIILSSEPCFHACHAETAITWTSPSCRHPRS